MAFPVKSPKQFIRGYVPLLHRGIDYGWYVGGVKYPLTVYAVAGGTVTVGNDDGQAGNYVNLQVGNKRWFYAHLASFNVRSGQTVRAGQVLGTMGETGNSRGVHLHLGLFIDGKMVNPAPYLKEDDMYKGKSAKFWYNEVERRGGWLDKIGSVVGVNFLQKISSPTAEGKSVNAIIAAIKEKIKPSQYEEVKETLWRKK